MNEDEILNEAKEVEQEIKETKSEIKKSPLWIILGFVLALLIILTVVPFYSIRLDPEPSKIPSIEEIVPASIELNKEENNITDFNELVNPLDPVIKQTANKVISIACSSNRICNAKALYYFVRDNIQYVNDPVNAEYLEEPRELLVTKSADCESGSILLAALLESVGINSQIVLIPGHAFVRIDLRDARKGYKQPDGWIYLDWTCSNCEFGEIPYQNVDKYKSFVDVR